MNSSRNLNSVGAKPFFIGLLAWIAPGAGHLWLGKVGRGAQLAGAVYLLLILGWGLSGHFYGPESYQEVGMLAYIFGLCDLGNGLIYIFSLASNIGVLNQAQQVTAEYGDRFLMVAGLLNYLVALDAFDICVGRKN